MLFKESTKKYEITKKRPIPVIRMIILLITFQRRMSIDFLCHMVEHADDLDILA